jgi:hypothetical protein
MRMPGFNADVSLAPAVAHYRAHSSPFTPPGAVLPQLDENILFEADEENEDGTKTHVTVSVFTPFNPESEPAGFEGSSWAGGEELSTGKWAKARECRERCRQKYNAKKLACAIDENPRDCEFKEFSDFLDCYGACAPVYSPYGFRY